MRAAGDDLLGEVEVLADESLVSVAGGVDELEEVGDVVYVR
jgi:hypothetical protein